MYSLANSLPTDYSLESVRQDINNKVTFLSNKNFSEVVPKEELKAIIREAGVSEVASGSIDTSHFITEEILESKGFLTTHQDIGNLATREELEKRVTKEELEEKHYVTNEQISSTYATKSEIPQPYSDTELVKRITVLENRQDNDTLYDDAELKRRVTALEERPTTGGSVDTSNLVTKTELKEYNYATQDSLPIPLYKEYTSDDFNEYSKQDYGTFLISNTRLRGKVFLNPNYAYTSISPLVYTGDGVEPKTAEYDAVLYTVASSLPDGYRLESINENVDNKVTFLSNKNFSEVVPKEELKAIMKEILTELKSENN